MQKEHNAKLKSALNIKAFTLTDDSYIPVIREQIRSKSYARKELEKSGIVNNVYEISNLVAYVGIQEIMKYLANQDVNIGGINYGALGDGTASPSINSTVLDNEVYRKIRASAAYADNAVYVDFVYLKADVAGTFTEFGTFINSTATPDAPYLFSYIDTGGWIKSNLETLFVSCEYSITNA
jgi:hypothetical protein